MQAENGRHSDEAAELRGVWFRWHNGADVGSVPGFRHGGKAAAVGRQKGELSVTENDRSNMESDKTPTQEQLAQIIEANREQIEQSIRDGEEQLERGEWTTLDELAGDNPT